MCLHPQGWSLSSVPGGPAFFIFFNCVLLGRWECFLMHFYLFIKNSRKSCQAPEILSHIYNHDAPVNPWAWTRISCRPETLTLSSPQTLHPSAKTVCGIFQLPWKRLWKREPCAFLRLHNNASSFIGVGGTRGRGAMRKDRVSPEKTVRREHYSAVIICSQSRILPGDRICSHNWFSVIVFI